MKRRKGVTVFGILALLAVIAVVALYVVNVVTSKGFDQLLPTFLDNNTRLVSVFGNFNFAFDPTNVDAFKSTIELLIALGAIGIFALFGLIWLIVDLVRRRHILWAYLALLLIECYMFALNGSYVTNAIEQFIRYGTFDIMDLVRGGVLVFALLLLIILFFVDMGTGKREKAPAPEFAREPEVTAEAQPVYEEVKAEEPHEEVYAYEADLDEEEAVVAVEDDEPQEESMKEVVKKAAKTVAKAAAKKTVNAAKKVVKNASSSKKTQTINKAEVKKASEAPLLVNEDGQTYAKAYHISRRPELNKWQIKATGSDKALKLFNTQKEAMEYANTLSQNQGVSVRVHSKEGKIRKANIGPAPKK